MNLISIKIQRHITIRATEFIIKPLVAAFLVENMVTLGHYFHFVFSNKWIKANCAIPILFENAAWGVRCKQRFTHIFNLAVKLIDVCSEFLSNNIFLLFSDIFIKVSFFAIGAVINYIIGEVKTLSKFCEGFARFHLLVESVNKVKNAERVNQTSSKLDVNNNVVDKLNRFIGAR